MPSHAILIGNSDGIGLALTRTLLARHWHVSGLSRSASPVEHAAYEHRVADVRSPGFAPALAGQLRSEETQLVVYCAGIGDRFDLAHLESESATLETNLLGLVRTVESVVPHFVRREGGVLVGLSSLADELRTREAPAYGASKAGMSHYLESLGCALQRANLRVVNVRLGFVATKMAKAPSTPFILEPEVAAQRILAAALSPKPPLRLNIPRRMALLTRLVRPFSRFL